MDSGWQYRYRHDLASASDPAAPFHRMHTAHSSRQQTNVASVNKRVLAFRGDEYRSFPIRMKILRGNITDDDVKWELRVLDSPPQTLMLASMHGQCKQCDAWCTFYFERTRAALVCPLQNTTLLL